MYGFLFTVFSRTSARDRFPYKKWIFTLSGEYTEDVKGYSAASVDLGGQAPFCMGEETNQIRTFGMYF